VGIHYKCLASLISKHFGIQFHPDRGELLFSREKRVDLIQSEQKMRRAGLTKKRGTFFNHPALRLRIFIPSLPAALPLGEWEGEETY
jgi:hypothetical protein